MRQMKASGANVLVAGEVRSAAVSFDQIYAMFAASSITLLTVSQIEAQEL
jgi:hypothetical protein